MTLFTIWLLIATAAYLFVRGGTQRKIFGD